ncbi:hypothetical protein L3X38_011440 [Prunus dulcis]|uniref:Reverse transcriptase domain-containing protein n=1 Tax=Prunus dulcis TaxID=3755 RepID=A0AAD4WJ32_PRUDU|nr:hypothetical protein L3X38_011440 [Prunus dulcis]
MQVESLRRLHRPQQGMPKGQLSTTERIDQLIDTTSGNQLLNFIDTSSGYNQILMHKENKAKTSFIIEKSTYCYKVIPFGLKNAGATYQRLMNKIFREHIDKTIGVYVDDMLVKAPQQANHIKNLVEAFVMLKKYRLKLNLSKSHLKSHPANFGTLSHPKRHRSTT